MSDDYTAPIADKLGWTPPNHRFIKVANSALCLCGGGRLHSIHWNDEPKETNMKKIDPTERALDAYFQLDTDQKATFALALKHCERFAATLGQSAPAPKPLGRPKGSKNRTPTAAELDLRHNNGAATEGL